MRPFVERAQKLPPGVPRVANPTTRAGLAAFQLALRIGASKPVAALAGRLFAPPADEFVLPDYAHLERA